MLCFGLEHARELGSWRSASEYGPFHIISFSLAAYNSDPRNYPDSSDFLEVFKDLLGRERGGVPRGSTRTLGDPPWGLSLRLEGPRKPRESH